METLIENFVKINNLFTNHSGSGNGYGYGSGDGSGDGNGSGDGSGYGNGNGSGSGYGSGYGHGSGDGNGHGSGYGNGDGYGSGDGNGYSYGYGDDILSYNNQKVYKIDNLQTIITHVKNNIAKGFILKSDLTLEPCYIVKEKNIFSHGSTVKEAFNSLQEKLLLNTPIEERIENFKKHFNKNDKYINQEFYKWHHILTGSCKFGRDNFIKENNIDLKKSMTVLDFITLTQDNYNGEIIKQLKEYYENI